MTDPVATFTGIKHAVPVTVDNRVRVEVSGPHDPVSIALKARFTYDNPAYRTWKTFRMGAPPEKQITTWATEQRGRLVTVPRGGVADTLAIIREAGCVPTVNDLTVDPPQPHLFVHAIDERPLWPHQTRLVENYIGHAALYERWDAESVPTCAMDGFRTGLWRAPQGSGKTQAVLALALRLQTTTLIVVSTGALFEQWAIRVKRELGMEPGIIQGARRVVRPITIGMAQTLAKCASDYADAFGFVCLDEAQLCPSNTMQSVFDCFRARYRLGVSGDERRADSKEFLTYDTFGPVSCEIDRTSIVRSGEIVDVEVRVVPTDFRADWYVRLGADDPTDERQRVRAAREKVHHRARLLEEMTNDQKRNELAVDCALIAAGGKQFIVLSDRVEQCQRIDSMLAAQGINSGLFIGGASFRQQFELTLAGMRNGSVRAGVGTYQAIGVGFEANRELGVGLCASPCVFNSKSRMQFMQYRNRLARSAPGKTRGLMYYLWDRHVYGINPVRLLCQWNKSVKVHDGEAWVDGKQFVRNA